MHPALRFTQRLWPLAVIGLVVFAIVVVRAAKQSVTWDEATTYLAFVWHRPPSLWFPDPNNHVLNTMLESLSVQIFGPSQFTIRFPAMMGAFVYLLACVALCARYVNDRRLAACSLACLSLNPFVLDYLVAARGYGLALAFLTAEIAILCVARDRARSRVRLAIAASIAAGLSIASNFSFGIAAVVALTVFGAIFALDRNERRRVRLGAALLFPAPLVALWICGPALTNFDAKRELVYGATTVAQMLGSIVSNSFDGPSPYIVNYDFMWLVVAFRNVGPIAIGVTIVVAFAFLFRERTLARNPALAILVILTTTLVVEVVLATLSHTPYPLNRTILFAAPLLTLVACIATAAVRNRAFVNAATIVIAATALFFVFSLRTYFREWAFDSNVAQTYRALRQVETADPKRIVVTDRRYADALNFYQATDLDPKFPPVDEQLPSPGVADDRAVYVLSAGDDDDFVWNHHLKIIYSYPGIDSPNTDLAVKAGAVRPVFARPPS